MEVEELIQIHLPASLLSRISHRGKPPPTSDKQPNVNSNLETFCKLSLYRSYLNTFILMNSNISLNTDSEGRTI